MCKRLFLFPLFTISLLFPLCGAANQPTASTPYTEGRAYVTLPAPHLHHALNPHHCPYGAICVAHPDADDATHIHLYWNNSYFSNFKQVDFKVHGKFIKGGGKDFNHIAYHLEPGETIDFILVWTLCNDSDEYDYYINSEDFSLTVPEIWDSLAAYKIGEKVQYEGKVYCARESYQGHGDPSWIKSSLWRRCSLL